MSFFEPPEPPPPPEPQPPQPPWLGPPANELGCGVPLRVVLARTDDAAIAIAGGVAYSTGFALTVLVRRRPVADEDGFKWPFGRQPFERGRELTPDVLRFGLQFADGRKGTTLGLPSLSPGGDPAGVVLVSQGSHGSTSTYDADFWVWPLPPPGPLALVVEWPARGVELTRHEVDAASILEASGRSEVLWPDEPLSGGWRAYGPSAL